MLRWDRTSSGGVSLVHCHGVAVEKQDGNALASAAVMQPDAVHLDEGTLRPVPALRPACREVVGNGQDAEASCAGQCSLAGGTGRLCVEMVIFVLGTNVSWPSETLTRDQAGSSMVFLHACNHARRLKALRGLTPYELICPAWTQEPQRFRINASHHTPGPCT